MTLRSVTLQLRDDQIEQLDAQAHRTGVSRSHLVREAIDHVLAPVSDRSVAEQHAAAYPERVSGADDWGDLDAWRDAAARSRAAVERHLR